MCARVCMSVFVFLFVFVCLFVFVLFCFSIKFYPDIESKQPSERLILYILLNQCGF